MTISVGAKNSGTAGTALIVIDQLDMMDKIKAMRFSDTKEGLEDLKNGKVDSLFIVSGAPVELLSGFESAILERFGLLPFTGEQYNRIIKNQYHYKKATVGPRDYTWLKENINTLAVVSTIIVNKNVPDHLVSDMIKAIFANRKELRLSHPKWREMDDTTIRWYLEGRGFLFHKAAKKAFEAAGLKGESLLSE
jgi:TRAP transporter TAXI family solute receptor